MSNHPASKDAPSSSSASLPAGENNSNVHDQNATPQDPAPGLYAPSLANDNLPDDSIASIVARLMNPPAYLRDNENNTFTLTITWAVGVAGPEHFQLLPISDRLVLQGQNELRLQGEDAGLSKEIMDWLKGGEDTLMLPASHFE